MATFSRKGTCPASSPTTTTNSLTEMEQQQQQTAAATTTGVSASPPRRSLWLVVSLALDFAVMLSMVALDVRDLWYKTRWIGPSDSYSFSAVASQSLRPQSSLAASISFNRSIDSQAFLPRRSGWSSFLSKCDDVLPFSDSSFFLHAMAINCTLGAAASKNSVVVPKIIMSGSIRADSLAWAACRLLRSDRKPVICRTSVTKNMALRYNMAETQARIRFPSRDSDKYEFLSFNSASPPTLWPHTDAESELLELLSVISRSGASLSRMTCIEAFEYETPGHYTSSIFGCGSATRFESAFAGHFAADLASLQQNKAWLTGDALPIMGVAFLIRQNSWALSRVLEPRNGTLVLENGTLINFSSSGMLYTLTVIIDAVLLIVNLVSSMEIARLVLWPLLLEILAHKPEERRVGTNRAPFAFEDYRAILTCPLFRSTPLAILMLISQSLSWMLVLPNSVIWTWTESLQGKLQAYLSTLRIWVVPLILVNMGWNVVVYFAERLAFAVTSRAYVTVLEVLCITSIVAYAKRTSVFSIGSAKYALDLQRHTDFQSFEKGGFIAFGNGFPETLETQQTTSAAILWTIYGPLVSIVGWSVVGIALRMLLRYVYYAWWCRVPTAVSRTDSIHIRSGPGKSGSASVSPVNASVEPPPRYKRLPIETLLNLPIRARSLIRNSFHMETSVKHKSFLRPSCYVEHGIIMEHHKLRTRQGFFGTVRYSTDAELHAMPAPEAEEERRNGPVPFNNNESVRQAEAAAIKLQKRKRVLLPLR